MTEADFAVLRRLVKGRSGLDLGPEKRYLAESRLAPLCRTAGLASLAELVRALAGASDDGLAQAVVDAMATHETMFFRDRAPFETLRTEILPALVAARTAGRRLRIWSAAASTGQEAYSVAMLLADSGAPLRGWHVSILGTDLSAAAIARAQRGFYSQLEVQRGLPVRHLLRHFNQVDGNWQITDALRYAVEFRRFNLLDDLTGLGRFDVILCRNLLIYLDTQAKAALLDRLAGALAPDGVLCLGTAETVIGLGGALAPHPRWRGFFVKAGAEPGASARLDAAE